MQLLSECYREGEGAGAGKMCSNNDGNACSGGGDDGGASLRKHKRPRVPKRGPGVAELERILSEQEGRDVEHLDIGKLGGSPAPSSQCVLPNGFQYSHNSVLRNVTFVPDQVQTHFSNGTGSAGNVGSYNSWSGDNACGGSYGSGGCRGVRIGGSAGIVLPEKALIPANWGSGEQQSSHSGEGSRAATGYAFPSHMANGSDQSHHMVVPHYPMLHKKNCQFHPSMVNFIMPPTFLASSTPFSAGMYQHVHVEPPSNQRLVRTCNSTWPREDQASACKRQWPFTGDNHPIPPSSASQPAQRHLSMHMLGPSSSTGNNVMLSLGPPSSSFGPKMEKCVMDSGAPNNSSFSSPSVPSPQPRTCQQGFSKLNSLQLQLNEGYEESYQRLATNGLIQRNPQYSFLLHDKQTDGAKDTMISFINERPETRDGIDLNLKL